MMVILIGFSVYQDSLNLGVGLEIFLTGIPVFYITNFLRNRKPVIKLMSKLSNISLLHVPQVPNLNTLVFCLCRKQR